MGVGRTPNIFCSFFSQNPKMYFTFLLYTSIYYIFGCAARAVDARFPTMLGRFYFRDSDGNSEIPGQREVAADLERMFRTAVAYRLVEATGAAARRFACTHTSTVPVSWQLYGWFPTYFA